MSLDPARQRKLIAAARLLESDKGGEQQAALQAVKRLLPEGLTLADLLERALSVPERPNWFARAQVPDWQTKARAILRHSHRLNRKDREFARNIAGAVRRPTDKQMLWLDDLAERVEAFV